MPILSRRISLQGPNMSSLFLPILEKVAMVLLFAGTSPSAFFRVPSLPFVFEEGTIIVVRQAANKSDWLENSPGVFCNLDLIFRLRIRVGKIGGSLPLI